MKLILKFLQMKRDMRLPFMALNIVTILSALTQIRGVHFYDWIIFQHIHHTPFIYSPIERWLHRFHFLTAMNNAGISFSLSHLWECVFHKVYNHLHSHQECVQVPLSPNLLHIRIFVFLKIDIPSGVTMTSHCCLFWSPLVVSGPKYLVYSLAMWMSCFANCPLRYYSEE